MIYIDAPVSYLAEGMAKQFYEGLGGLHSDQFEDPTVVNYFVIEARYEAEADENGSPIGVRHTINESNVLDTSQSDVYSVDSRRARTFNGTRLVGIIPCSDAFGVDLIIEKYQ